ncbi:MAG TPA: RDD family protein [Steroidobacteraceae bacterium]|nr:RDD family protein [Steroidobacteraceae bacterium]
MSQVAPGLIIDSVTGIDVSLPVAGPGVRSFAFIIDWHIRAVLALGWYVAAGLLYNGRWSLSAPLTNDARWFATVVLPALAIYFLYQPVAELAMRGRTPGKRSAGIRVVTRQGGPPGAGPLLVRNVFRLIDSLPAFYGVGLTLVVFTREHVRCGDMAAGTLLVYERSGADALSPEAAAMRLGALDAAGAEIVADLLQRWPALTPEARVRLARAVLQRYLGPAADLSDADELQWRARVERLASR